MTPASAHTAGAWSIGPCVLRSFQSPTIEALGIAAGTKLIIAHMDNVDGFSGSTAANAMLISAAPELLAALEETLAAMRALRGLAFTGSRIPVERYPEKAQADLADARARAAISKARGAAGGGGA